MSDLKITVEDGIATVTMDVVDKPMNVVTPALRDEFAAAIEKIATDPSIKAAIVTSAKSDFLAGGDLKAMLARFDETRTAVEIYEQSRPFGDLIRRLETCGKPFVAAINGLALGGGFELALACHHRVVSDAPKLLLGLPEATLGLMPGAGGTQRVARMLGVAVGLPLLMKGETFSAQKALELKLVDAIVPAADLLAAAKRWILDGGDPVKPWDKKDFKVPGGSALGTQPLGPIYNVTATGIARDTQRNRPAPIAITSAVARGLPLPMDAGLRVERREFVKLLQSPITRNIIRTQFVSKGEAEKLARRPKGPAEKKFTKIGILGAGLMGVGIAHVAALAGIDVVLLDASADGADKGRAKVDANLATAVKKGKLAADKAEAALKRIVATADYARLAGAELVIEAVFEDREVKQKVLKTAHAVLGDDVIYASNTSTIPITGLAETVPRQECFIGMHFFSPVDRMALLEIVKGKKTSDETLAHALDFAKQIRKAPIVVNDARGFFTSRVISTYLSEAMGMLAEGVNPALVENAAKQAGFPLGPLSLIDEATLQLGFDAANQARRDLGDGWVEPPGYKVQKKFCEELNRKGRRYGGGFYEYPEGGTKRLWTGLSDVYPRKANQPTVEEVKQRLLYIQALEATRCLEQGVLESVQEGDVGSTLGIGYPAWTGGVFSLIDTVGLKEFVATCTRFADAYGERWRPSKALVARASEGGRMYPAASSSS